MKEKRRERRNGSARKNKSLYRRLRHWYRRHKKQAIYSVAACLCTILILGVLAVREQNHQKSMQVTAENAHDIGSGYRDIIYEGRHYRYNSLMKLVLYAGIDGTGEMRSSVQYGNKDRADVIFLIIMDKLHEKITVLPISRDTMTEIRKYSLNGSDAGLYTTHLGYAYSYGDGGKVSCENLCEAVSKLLGNIPVREYVVTNQDSMPYINDFAGGITLTVPNGDLEAQNPEFAEGAEVALNKENISTFLRFRDTDEEFSNEGRMERQMAYVAAYIERMQNIDMRDLIDKWEEIENMEGHLQTSLNRNEYLEMVDLLQELSFSEVNFEVLEGENREGELHDEFHLDEEALQRKIIELFYEEV